MAENILLRPTVAPSLPVATEDYQKQYTDQYSNILRLYFNQLDNFTRALTTGSGGASLTFPHIAASDTTDQYATADNTPTIVKWNTLDYGLGFSLNPAYYAVANYSGIYKIDYSLQFANTANAAHDAVVWLQVNGVDVPRSTSKITMPARKSAGVPSYMLMYSTIPFQVEAGDEIALWWATDLAYSTTGPVDGVYMEYAPAQTVPYAHPSVPSAIGAITFVSAV